MWALYVKTMKLEIYNAAKDLLDRLEINDYAQALKFPGSKSSGKVNVSGKEFSYEIYASVFPPDDEIMVVACIYEKSLPLDKADNVGYLYCKDKSKEFYSQEMLWDYGF